MVDLQEERPAFVRFEVRVEENRDASIAEGHFVGKDVEYAIIQPIGGNFATEQEVKAWFDRMRARGDRFLDQYERVYDAWKKGQEEPVDGTSIRNWPALSPAQVANYLAINIRTIEDIATANEPTLMRMGMGSRAIQQKAIAYLSTAKDTGKVAEQLAAMQVQIDGMAQALKDKDQIIAEQQAQLSLPEKNVVAKQENRSKTPAKDINLN